MHNKSYSKHYEQSVVVEASADKVFAYVDDLRNFSSHMNQSSWMMGGGYMKTETDKGGGQKVGSHIRMKGKVFGINLFLDEVIIEHVPPFRKAWETVGVINLLVIDHYKFGFKITTKEEKSLLKVHIDYNLPRTLVSNLLGRVFSGIYARWCVGQMVNGAQKHFNPHRALS